MKKRLLSLAFSLPLILTSCNSGVTFAKLKEKVNTIEKSSEHPYYRVIGAIDYNAKPFTVDETFDKQPEANKFVPYARYNEGFYNESAQILYDESVLEDDNILIYMMASRSYWLRAPMKIDKDNFYKTMEDGKLNPTCAYANLIKIIATWYGTSNNPTSKRPYYEITKNGFVIGAKEIHTTLTIDNFPVYPDHESHPDEISEWDEYDPLPVYLTKVNAKVNIRFEYDSNGWLKREYCASVGYDYSKVTAGQFSLESRYVYRNETTTW